MRPLRNGNSMTHAGGYAASPPTGGPACCPVFTTSIISYLYNRYEQWEDIHDPARTGDDARHPHRGPGTSPLDGAAMYRGSGSGDALRRSRAIHRLRSRPA